MSNLDCFEIFAVWVKRKPQFEIFVPQNDKRDFYEVFAREIIIDLLKKHKRRYWKRFKKLTLVYKGDFHGRHISSPN